MCCVTLALADKQTMFEKEMEEDQDNFEWSLTPQNASEENKSGVTIKGKNTEYWQIEK